MSQHELCPSIKAALESLSTELTSAEVARTALLSQLQAHIVNEFAKYPHKLKVQEVNIRARNKAFEKFVKKQKAFVALKGNARPERQAHAKEVFDGERQRLQGAEATLNASLAAFETARVKEMQGMLKKFISSQIHFFGKSMEGLSLAYAKVCEIDGEREGERLVEEMKKLEALEQKDDHGQVEAKEGGGAASAQAQQPSAAASAQGAADPAAAAAGQTAPQQPQQQMGYPQPAHTLAPLANTQPQQPQHYPPNAGGTNPAAAPALGYGAQGPPSAANNAALTPPHSMQPTYTGPLQSPTHSAHNLSAYHPHPTAAFSATLPHPQPGGYPIQTNFATTSQLPLPQTQGSTVPVAAAGSSGYSGYGYGANANRYSAQSVGGPPAQFSANGYTLTNVESKI